MNFFESQEIARHQSRRLIWLFALAVLAVVIAINLLVVLLVRAPGQALADLAGMLGGVTVVTLAVIGLSSLYRIASLRGGGARVAQELGGTQVGEDVSDPDYRRLRNVVEEVAIASGVPVPDIFVLEDEPGINAFAAGYSPSDAAVAVTRGALEKLNRDELQGVVAHEFSHVLNGDMRLNIRLVGVLFGILVIALMGRRILFNMRLGGSRDSRGVAVAVLIALAAMVVGYVGMLFGRLIKAGISRQREYLADASAVQFTRQTRGISGALKKIGGVAGGSRLAHRAEGEEFSHMLFGDGMGFSGLFATHPPLLRRIQALEPAFKPDELKALGARWETSPPVGREEDRQLGFAPRPLPPVSRDYPATSATPAAIAAHVGDPDEADYEHAFSLVDSVPARLADAAHHQAEAPALLLGLLLDHDAEVGERQLALIGERLGAETRGRVEALAQDLGTLTGLHRLPLAAMAFPALRRRPRPQLERFVETVQAVSQVDGVIDLFEYCLGRMLQVQVSEALDPGRYWKPGRHKLPQVRDEAVLLLAFLARAGHSHSIAARRAFNAGVTRLFPGEPVEFVPPRGGPQLLDRIWAPLDALGPPAKKLLVEALAAVAGNDGRVSVAEAELLRTVCASLHCPLPPLLERH